MASDEAESRTLKFTMEQDPAKALPATRSAAARKAKPKPVAQLRSPSDAYAQTLRWSFGATLVTIAAIVGLTYGSPVTIFKVAVLAGALGAFFSGLIRLTSADDIAKLMTQIGALKLSIIDRAIYALVPPVVGAIAAAFLYVMFAAGLIEGGSFFPTFSCKLEAGCTTLENFLNDFGPSDAVHYARLTVWAFLAGFAERLVPDKLKGLRGDGSPTVKPGRS